MTEPNQDMLNNACLRYDHSFGLMEAKEQERLRFQAKEWREAWRKTTDPRSFPQASDGRAMPPMGYTVLTASKGLLDWEGSAELARSLRDEGYYLVRTEDIGWPEINAYHDELNKGQSVWEDGGGFFVRCIMALFGKKPDEVETYQQAAARLLAEAKLSD